MFLVCSCRIQNFWETGVRIEVRPHLVQKLQQTEHLSLNHAEYGLSLYHWPHFRKYHCSYMHSSHKAQNCWFQRFLSWKTFLIFSKVIDRRDQMVIWPMLSTKRVRCHKSNVIFDIIENRHTTFDLNPSPFKTPNVDLLRFLVYCSETSSMFFWLTFFTTYVTNDSVHW